MKWLISIGRRMVMMRRRWLGLLAGCVLWLGWMIFGFWNTVLLLVLAGLGFAVGRVLEERRSWKQVIDKLLTEHYRDS